MYLFFILLLTFLNYQVYANELPTEFASLDSFADNSTVAQIETLQHNNLALQLEFKEPVVLSDFSQHSWNDALKAPYLKHASRWLRALGGVPTDPERTVHTISFTIAIYPTRLGYGLATAREFSQRGKYTFPTRGALLISGYTYTPKGAPAISNREFDTNILHEMGHVFGFNDMMLPYLGLHTDYGIIFDVNGEAAKYYQEIYHVPYDFIPISDDRGHLYDFLYGQDDRRINTLIPLAPELMAHGYFLGKITLGVFADLGYQVNYDEADEYILPKPKLKQHPVK